MSTRIEPVHRGAYSAGTTYSVNELVDWQGNVYWHKSYESTTGVDPSNTEIWAWVSDAGDAQPYIDRAENSARVAEAAEIAAASAKTDAEAAKPTRRPQRPEPRLHRKERRRLLPEQKLLQTPQTLIPHSVWLRVTPKQA